MKNIFFDLDGTLSDSAPGIIKSLQYAFERLHLKVPTPQDLRGCVGPPLQESLKKFLQDESLIPKAIGFYRERYGVRGLIENHLYPGMRELLEKLKSDGYTLFVATAKPTVYSAKILVHFKINSFFKGCYGSELDGRHTNKAELLNFLLQKENLIASESLMIGDRSFDIIAAEKNSVQSIGVLYGYGDQAELQAAGARHFAKSPAEIYEIISSRLDLK